MVEHNAAVIRTFLALLCVLAAVPALAAEPAADCLPLRPSEPAATADAPSDDLRTLAGWLGGPRVIALGESVHGSRTLHRLAHRVFAYLADEEGFTVFALEIDQAHAAHLDAWVQGERDDLDALLAERWYGSQVFYDRALVELLHWMRRRNESRKEAGLATLHVSGFDMKQPRLAADAAVAALRRADPRAAAEVEALYARALEPGAFGLFPNVSGFTGVLPVALPESTGTPLRVEVEVRGDGVDYGEVGVFALGAGRTLLAGEVGSAWQTLVLDLERPAGRGFDLLLVHRGDGTVELGVPRVTLGGEEISSPDLAAVTPRPLMMPRLQRMDYAHDVVAVDGRPVLRVSADPVLGRSREAVAAAEALVGRTLPHDRWARRYARLVTQAVEWRILVERNRDAFLAENLRWLADTAFPGARLVALTHASHAGRHPTRMGGFLADALGDRYRVVTLQAVSGRYRYFGDVSEIHERSKLELHDVAWQADAPVDCLRRERNGETVDAVVYVAGVEPIE
jgi:erythromycin esterase-like protein